VTSFLGPSSIQGMDLEHILEHGEMSDASLFS